MSRKLSQQPYGSPKYFAISERIEKVRHYARSVEPDPSDRGYLCLAHHSGVCCCHPAAHVGQEETVPELGLLRRHGVPPVWHSD